MAAATETSTQVRRPAAAFIRHSRSAPTIAPNRKASGKLGIVLSATIQSISECSTELMPICYRSRPNCHASQSSKMQSAVFAAGSSVGNPLSSWH